MAAVPTGSASATSVAVEAVPCSGVLRLVLKHVIPDARAAWRFLSEESPFSATPARPIDALKAGDVDAVRKAAQAQGEAFS